MLNNMGLGFTFKATDEASPVMKEVQSNLTKTASTMKEVGRGFEKVGTASTIAGGALAAGLGLAVDQAAKFQTGVAQVATEADAAKLPMSEIARLAKTMATTYGGDLDTQIKALYQGVAAGADDATKSLSLLDGANRLAIAGNTSQEIALLGITKVLNNYGMAFTESTDVADAFFVAVKGGQTTVGELGQYIGEVASTAKSAGVSMTELIAAMGTGATLMRDTGAAATGLKAALANVAKPTSEAAAEAAKLGIKFNSAELRAKGLKGFIDEITHSAKYSADSMNNLFGSIEAAGVMTALASNGGAAFNQMMGDMANRAGGAQAAFELMSNTLAKQGDILKANVNVALVDLGTALLPVVTQVTKFFVMLVKGFNSLPQPVKSVIAFMAAFLAVGLLVAGGIATIIGLVLTAETPLLILAGALGTVVGIMGPMVVLGGLLAGTIYTIQRAFDENVGGLKDTVIPIFDKIKLTWDALTQAFEQGGFSGSVRNELAKAENSGIKNFVVNLHAWVGRILNFFEGLKKGFSSALDAAGPTFARFSIALDRLGAAFGKLFGGAQNPDKAAATFDKFGDAGKTVGAVLEKMAEIVVTGVTMAINFATAFLATIDRFKPTFEELWNAAGQVGAAFGQLGTALGQVAASFGITTSATGDNSSMLAGFIGILAKGIAISAEFAAVLINSVAVGLKAVAAVVTFLRPIVAFFIDQIERMVAAAAKVGNVIQTVTGGKALAGVMAKSMVGNNAAGAGPPNAVAAAKSNVPQPIDLMPMDTSSSGGHKAVSSTASNVPASATGTASTPTVAGVKAAGQQASGAGGAPSADQMGVAMAAAIKAAPPPPVQVTMPVFLDSSKIGEAMSNTSTSAREFKPAPHPTG